MKKTILIGVALAAMAGAAEGVKLVFPAENQRNWENRTRVAVGAEAGEDDLVVLCAGTQRCETAWRIASAKVPLKAGTAGYALDFEIYADADWIRCEVSETWGSSVEFLDAADKTVGRRPLDIFFHKKTYAKFRFSGEVPEGAAAARVVFGVDGPNLPPGQRVAVRQATFRAIPKGEAIPAEIVYDVVPPLVTSRFKAPSPDPDLKVRYEIADESGVDWATLSVSNSATKAAVPFTREGGVITLKPGAPWSAGQHVFVISVCDTAGNRAVSHKVFLSGEAPKTPRTSLRDDGITLIDGKPFFPIGIYGVKKAEFNAWNFDRACGDLKAAGFNTMHSYGDNRNPEFLAAVRKYGLMMWSDSRHAVRGDTWVEETGRHEPTLLSWYIGDDTAMNTKPYELLDRQEAARMLDGTRITCQADVVHGGARKTDYQDFVPYSDVLLPELYFFYSTNRSDNASCVAYVIRDMDRARADAVKYGQGRPKGLWPILQAFNGRSWRRYPDPDELYATSFAALIHGATGITWFHYAGELCPERGRRYSGAFQTQKDWATMTNLTTRIAALAPVFLERTPPQPKAPEVVGGEKLNPLGKPSVSVLVKKHEGSTYVFAVNASPKPARARIFAPVKDGEGSVAWEKRKVKAAGGAFEDDFKGFGVHVYRFQ